MRTSLQSYWTDLTIAARIAAAAADISRPILANLIVTRRCNLSCGYCHEYDKTSPPVPLRVLMERIDHLHRLRTTFVTLTGGESLLHPEIEQVVAYIHDRGMIPLLNTNGYLLTRARILALNKAGLYGMQISVDNIVPNEVTVKSLKPLLPKLKLLSELAQFRVRVGTVLGSGAPEQAVEVARTALRLGLETKAQLARDARGALLPVDDATRRAYDEILRLGRRSSFYLGESFQRDLLRDGQVEWKCRAGGRYFHVNEDGIIQFCPAHPKAPGVHIADYGKDDIRRAFNAVKPCAATCTQPYAHQISRLDALRPQPMNAAHAPGRAAPARVYLPVL